MSILSTIFQDWKYNRKNHKGQLVLVLFRLATIARRNRILFVIWLPYSLFYHFFVEWFLGIELPYKVVAGEGLQLHHGQSLVVNKGVVLGKNCTLRHCTTIGNKVNTDGTASACQVIGDNVDIGSNSCIIGPVTIGNNVKIGAGTVVVKSIPDNCVVVGNPGKIIKQELPEPVI